MTQKNIGFHVFNFSFRGTEIALYDYADKNESILGNKSFIYAPLKSSNINNGDVVEKFMNRFQVKLYKNIEELEDLCISDKIDVVYIIKFGKRDELSLKKIPMAIHCVYEMKEPHGIAYAGVSETVCENSSQKVGNFVPHMITISPTSNDTLRKSLKIPLSSTVLGRHGGMDTFDFPQIKEAILHSLSKNENLHFIFMPRPYVLSQTDHPRIHYLDITADPIKKGEFIQSCDAMIHAQILGETQGISVLEFSRFNKPVITFNGGKAIQHLKNLDEKAIKYNNIQELVSLMSNNELLMEKIKKIGDCDVTEKYNPKNVMEKFKKIFIDPLYTSDTRGPPKIIHFMRHAQSTFNKFRDQSRDCEITDEGKMMSAKISGDYDYVIISPLNRTRLTLENSSIKYKNLIVSELCREKRDSNCDFLEGEEIIKETKEEVNIRIIKLRKLLDTLNGKILIISHGVFGYHLTGKSLGNCEIVTI